MKVNTNSVVFGSKSGDGRAVFFKSMRLSYSLVGQPDWWEHHA